MGHTLVTRFEPRDCQALRAIMDGLNANKIPFGRDCDREAANSVLEYHMTMLHWAKNRDAYYLDCLKDFKPAPSQIRVTDARIMYAEEGSQLLYFTVEPGPGFGQLVRDLEDRTRSCCSRFLHITLAVSKDPGEIQAIRDHIQNAVSFPFTLNVEGLDLYHIWKPTKLVRSL